MNILKVKKIWYSVIACWTIFTVTHAQSKLNLAGKWSVVFDSARVSSTGLPASKKFNTIVSLPGTLDDAGIGYPPSVDTDTMNKEVMRNLWRKKRFVGTAWYKRDIQIPASFQHKRIKLLLERVIWKTIVFIDGKEVGSAQSLSTPQEFNLPDLTPGSHTVILAIDNRKQYAIGDATHAYTDGTQIIWNGVIGKMEISARERSIEDVRILSDKMSDTVSFQIKLDKVQYQSSNDQIIAKISYNRKVIASEKIFVTGDSATVNIPISQPKFWDEFSPNLYTAAIQLLRSNKVEDQYTGTFGLRRLSNEHSLLHINGHRMFLRGTLECAIFPLTGHPPMQKQEWIRLMEIAKGYGLNHLRFHSWCPPEAAFAVADSLGMYLQVELPFWGTVPQKEDATMRFLKNEAELIVRNYGNHPSFCFFSMGNELEGNFDWLNNLVDTLTQQDPRRLYTTTTFSFGKGDWPQPKDQYYITQWTKKGWVRGQGIFNANAPRFDEDYSKSIAGLPVPVVSHEVGQYSVYPDIKEIRKYTGVLEPLNFVAVKKDLEKKGLLPLADDFLTASGKLAASLYKEEIERALKTPGMSGFQLLGLYDFPGQSTALVGLLDAFWDNKGILPAKDFSEFCGPVVPLLRFEKCVYTSDEFFSGTVEIANFTNKALKNQVIQWQIKNAAGNIVGSGEWKAVGIPIGNENKIGVLQHSLRNITTAEKLTVTICIKNSSFKNEWSIWVYPPVPETGTVNVHFTTSVKDAINLLTQGKTVLLNPDTAAIKGIPGRYTTVFWSPVHFPDQPGSMGLLIDSASSAFAKFPTETYSEWQWWDMVMHSKSMILDSLPSGIKPLIRVIDNFFKNRSLATLIEARSGKGKLIICSMDIHTDMDKRPVARQLRYSLMKYMESAGFNPCQVLSDQGLKKLFY